MALSSAWGYGAVVIPTQCAWQGFVVPDPKTMAREIGRAIASAHVGYATIGKEPIDSIVFGALQAALVRCMIDGMEAGVAIFSAAVSEVSGERFWVVDADEGEDGTATRFTALKVETAEQARDEIDRRVMPLHMGRVLRMMKEGK